MKTHSEVTQILESSLGRCASISIQVETGCYYKYIVDIKEGTKVERIKEIVRSLSREKDMPAMRCLITSYKSIDIIIPKQYSELDFKGSPKKVTMPTIPVGLGPEGMEYLKCGSTLVIGGPMTGKSTFLKSLNGLDYGDTMIVYMTAETDSNEAVCGMVSYLLKEANRRLETGDMAAPSVHFILDDADICLPENNIRELIELAKKGPDARVYLTVSMKHFTRGLGIIMSFNFSEVISFRRHASIDILFNAQDLVDGEALIFNNDTCNTRYVQCAPLLQTAGFSPKQRPMASTPNETISDPTIPNGPIK